MGVSRQDIRETNSKIEQGAWIKNLPDLPGVEVRVRGIPNSEYSKFVAKIRGNYSQHELADESVQEQIFVQALAECVLIDWKGIDDPFSKETALDYLTDPTMAVFRRAIDWATGQVTRTSYNGLDADLKNSSGPSAGA
jgi:hypothetical protein